MTDFHQIETGPSVDVNKQSVSGGDRAPLETQVASRRSAQLEAGRRRRNDKLLRGKQPEPVVSLLNRQHVLLLLLVLVCCCF